MEQSSLPERIRRGLSEPHLALRQVNRWYHRLRTPGERSSVDFFAEDWDSLLLLDACRYDAFAARCDLPGELESRRSRASATREFLYQYLDGADLRDTVYVTANPQLYKRREEVDVAFHDVIDVWQDEGWDEEYKTVHPETVARVTEEAAERYPNKRLLVHFMQPHFPFIGETGQRHLDLGTLEFGNGIMTGEVTVDDEVLWRAYTENLDIVLSSVRRLLDSLSGRTVVTADHGEMMGERSFPIPIREYGHPAGIRSEALNVVPWLVYEKGARREVTAGSRDVSAGTRAEVDSEVVEDRLRQLGYR